MDPVFNLSSELLGIKDEKHSKIAFFQKKFFKKTHEANFFAFFIEIVAEDPVQHLAKTWCPYLFWVLINLPHNFEKVAHVTKSAKKNVTIWATLEPQKSTTHPSTASSCATNPNDILFLLQAPAQRRYRKKRLKF